MSPKFPPELSTRAKVAIATVALLTFLYSVVVAAQILLWFVVVGFAVGLYLVYLLIVAVFRLVTAVERIATAAEVDSGIRTAADARTSASVTTSDGPAVSPASGGSGGSTAEASTTDAADEAPASDDSGVGGSDPDPSTADARPDDPADGSDPDGSDDPDPSEDRPDGG